MNPIATIALASALASLPVFGHGGGVDGNGGHLDKRTGEYHCHRKGCRTQGATPASASCERPSYSPTLDVDFMAKHGRIAPYSCRAVGSAKDVDIEHIVAFSEARKSGLPCSLAAQFMNDPLNIAVAFPELNRHQKSDKDIARWRPAHNLCWFADRVRRVKAKYGLSMDAAETAALDRALASCADGDSRISCGAEPQARTYWRGWRLALLARGRAAGARPAHARQAEP